MICERTLCACRSMGPGSLAHKTSVWVLFVLDVITGGYSVQNQYLDDRGCSCSICTPLKVRKVREEKKIRKQEPSNESIDQEATQTTTTINKMIKIILLQKHHSSSMYYILSPVHTVHCPSQLAEDVKNESKQLLKKDRF